MPNTKSAGRRMRNSARKGLQNRSTKSRLHNLERKYTEHVAGGNKQEAGEALRLLSSALDKAAKSGVIHRAKANRSKSRLTVRFNVVGAAAKAK